MAKICIVVQQNTKLVKCNLASLMVKVIIIIIRESKVKVRQKMKWHLS
jgi:hypothetical protein